MWGHNPNRNPNYNGPWLWLWHCGYGGPWLWRATICPTSPSLPRFENIVQENRKLWFLFFPIFSDEKLQLTADDLGWVNISQITVVVSESKFTIFCSNVEGIIADNADSRLSNVDIAIPSRDFLRQSL